MCRLPLVHDQAEGNRIDGEERVALLDGLIVMDIERDDRARHLGRDGDQIRAHIGIVGIGDEIGCDLIGEECRDDEADHQQNPSTPTHGSPLLVGDQLADLSPQDSSTSLTNLTPG